MQQIGNCALPELAMSGSGDHSQKLIILKKEGNESCNCIVSRENKRNLHKIYLALSP